MASFREQQIRFPFDDDAARVNRVLRERQLDVVRGVPLDEWTRPSRCTGWSVHDVVRHVVQMNEVMVGVVAATRAGERYERMRRFDPKTTPSAWLAEAPATEPEETLAAFERSTRAVIDVGDGLGVDVLVGSPVGLQPWPRVVLHALLDAVVHRAGHHRAAGPLRARRPGTAAGAGLRPADRGARRLLRRPRVRRAGGSGRAGAGRRRARSGVEVVPVGRNGELGLTNVATRGDVGGDAVVADPLRLLDGLTGRVPLDEVLPASDDVRAALGLLAPSL